MQSVLLVVHLIVAIVLIGAILLQRSEGGALGIGGSGAGGGNIFSSRGVGNSLTRLTAILAVVFFCTSAALTILATRTSGGGSVFEQPQVNNPAPEQPNTDNNQGGGSVLPNLGQGSSTQPAPQPQ